MKILIFISSAALTTLFFTTSGRTNNLEICDSQDELCVYRPFESITAISNLEKCIKLSSYDSEALSKIIKLQYRFIPEGDIHSENQRVILERTTVLSSNGLGSNRIIDAIEAQRGGSCENNKKIWNISVDLTGINMISVSYSIRVDIRDCGSFLGIEYKNDVGSAGADVVLTYSLENNFEISEVSRSVRNQWEDSNWTYDLLRYTLPSIGLFGLAISYSITDDLKSVSMASSEISSSALSSLFGNDFQVLASGITSAEDFRRDLDLIIAPLLNFQRVAAETGLVSLGDETSVLQLVERVSITPPQIWPRMLEWKKAEIKAIYELRFERPRIHIVEEGENLWSIASKYYVEPKMFALIESASKLESEKIEINQELIVPFYTDLCENNNLGRIIRPGDTVSALVDNNPSYRPSANDFRSKNIDLIYPFETIDFSN